MAMAISPFIYGGPGSSSSSPRSGNVLRESEPLPEAFTKLLSLVSSAGDDAEAEAEAKIRSDWMETPEAHIFKLDLPGVAKEEVRVSLEGSTLDISGELKEVQAMAGDKKKNVLVKMKERSRPGPFHRRFRLSSDALLDSAKANLDRGVLTIMVRKAKPQVRFVAIE